MMMMINERRDIKPILVKFGVALALSFAGFLYSRIRIKRIKPSDPPPSPTVSDSDKKVDYDGRIRVKDDPQPEMDSVDAYDKPCIRVRVDSSSMDASPNGRYSGDRHGFLLPEFDLVVKEFDAVNSSKTDGESFTINKDLPKSFRRVQRDDYEQEIENLKKRIKFLVERERKLEIQLLEYYGLKEQETMMMELKNRLEINNYEAKIFLMNTENLQAENKRLKTQVGDYSKVVSELEAAKAKIKLLKRKIRSVAEQNREQILDLTQRVVNFQGQEQEHEASTSISDDQSELQRLGELEAEAKELRKCNENLQRDNTDLAQRLESTQILANSLFEDPEKEELHKAMFRLREENDKFTKEVERLQEDRCADVEELVYLRWINACLRYELRNYQPPPGKTVARDLSKCLSPTSEQKAKQLILEYAITEDGADKEPPSLMDFDFDRWPSSQPSYLTDSTDYDESSGPSSVPQPHPKKIKFFANLRKLVRGISSHHHHHNHNQGGRASPIYRSFSVDDLGRRYYEAGNSGSKSNPQSPRLASSSQNSNNSSMEYQPLTSLAEEDETAIRMSDLRSSSQGGVSYVLGRERTGSSSPLDYTPDQESEYRRKSDLAKYAEVFGDSSWLQKHKKSASYSTGYNTG